MHPIPFIDAQIATRRALRGAGPEHEPRPPAPRPSAHRATPRRQVRRLLLAALLGR